MRACSYVALATMTLYLAWGCAGSGGDLFGVSSGSPSSDDDAAGPTTSSTGSGGGAAASSSANGGGASSSSSASTGGGVGSPCTLPGEPCGQGLYCDAPGCQSGTCQSVLPFNQEQAVFAPVCGCDHATYWNGSIAQSHAMAVHAAGECEGTGGGCSNTLPCPANTYCSKPVQGGAGCSFGLGEGRCWGLPDDCGVVGTQVRKCSDYQCGNICDVVKAEVTWYEGFGCN